MMNIELNKFRKDPKLTNKSTDMTSYYGANIETTINKLTRLLGYPNGGTCSKVSHSWNCELATGEVFTIYDWKLYKTPMANDIICFHIGGFNKSDTFTAREVLLQKLEEYNE